MALFRPTPMIGALLLLMLSVGLARAADLPSVGDTVVGQVILLGKHIPVPEGHWRVASAGYGRAVGEYLGPYGAIGGVLLVPAEAEPDQMFLLVHTNALPVRAGWGTSAACEGTLFSSAAEPHDLHEACTFVSFARRWSAMIADLPALAGTGATELSMPPWALVAGFRVSDRRDFVDMRFGAEPRSLEPSGWVILGSGGKPMLDARHTDFVHGLAEWAQTARGKVFAAMRTPPVGMKPLPAPPLDQLPDLAAAAPEDMSTLLRGAYKLATYRVINSTSTFILAGFLSGSVVTGGWITFWNAITHSAVYMANELAWEWPRPSPLVEIAAQPPGARLTVLRTEEPAASGTQLPEDQVLEGRQIPLPVGTWTRVAREDTPQVAGVVFAQIAGQTGAKSVRALAIARTSREKTASIIGAPADCDRRDIYFTVTRYDTPRDGYCAYGKKVVPAAATDDDPLWQTARERLIADGVALPPEFFTVGARARTQQDYLDLKYYFAPDAFAHGGLRPDGFAAGGAMLDGIVLAAAWPNQADTATSPSDRVEDLRAWSDLLQEPAELAVRGRLPNDDASLPPPWPRSAVARAADRQARAPIESLFANGAMDAAERDRQEAIAMRDAADREQQRWSLWTHSLAKISTYRAASYLDTLGTTWAVTGALGQGFLFANVNMFVKPVLAYVNEIGWAGSGVGAPRASLLSTTFPEIGPDTQ